MPGTTRYSATFDRTYEEDDKVEPITTSNTRRSRSLSWQANSGLDGRPYTPLAGMRPSQRSSSTDNSSSKGAENIPTRTVANAAVKAHNNPFQFVKVGSCSLYKKAEEQLKKVKEVKKPDVLKEEEEEWQSNLDSWKSRRRKMSEDVFKRQEEIRQFELEEQVPQIAQKKTKTFSEMVESRAHRGRTLSLCLISSPLELQNWEMENSNYKNGSNSNFSGGSEENSTANSEDEGVSFKGKGKHIESSDMQDISNSNRTNGDIHIINNGSVKNLRKSNFSRLSQLEANCSPITSKDGTYIDSGLESISSSHRAGDTPDSGSDFSQDSGSSMDCDSPRISGLINGLNLLDELNSKALSVGDTGSKLKISTSEISVKLCLVDECRDFGFTCRERKDDGYLVVSSVVEGSIAQSSGIHVGDQILKIDGKVFVPWSSDSTSILRKAKEKGQISLVLLRHCKIADSLNNSLQDKASSNGFGHDISGKEIFHKVSENGSGNQSSSTTCDKLENSHILRQSKQESAQHKERSVESENEIYVDDFEELKIKSKHSRQNNQLLGESPTKNTNNTKSSAPVIQKELVKSQNQDSLNIVFESTPVSAEKSENLENGVNKSSEDNSSEQGKQLNIKKDIPPVEQVAEEMEKLILEQLEEEERAKELAAEIQAKNANEASENILIAPPRHVEPPKEKPPPPPTNANETQGSSLKRTNSTKRIKKEIHKRRSNFLGIENADESVVCDETAIPPPPALEEILKAEMELDRESRKKLEYATDERLTHEESEILKKEREIIETVESEERRKHLLSNSGDAAQISDVAVENDRIQTLKEEKKLVEEERMVTEEQRLRLPEEQQLREREEYIRKQEGDSSPPVQPSVPLSVAATLPNTPKSIASPLSPETKSNISLSDVGDGQNILSNSAPQLTGKKNEAGQKSSVSEKPAVPPKPLKKKEAIRKERERLRQEQEALQREREEHRRKLIEQEEMLKNQQKPHAADAPASRLGPLPPLVKPNFSPQLTTSLSAPHNARESATFTSRSHHGAQNGVAGSTGYAEQICHLANRQTRNASSRGKAMQNEAWGQQKMPSVRKQNQDSLTESRYNQNHWLIQEAEMRRITELKERQRAAQLPCSQTHLAEDDVCSNNPRVPVLPLPQNQHLNYASDDKLWNYGHSGMGLKKYVNPVNSDKSLISYPREQIAQPPTKPSRVVPMERQEQMLSVSGRKRCSHCNEELGRGAAMIIESLQLYYHIHCFQCCVCQAQLGNGSCGTDVRVRNNKLHCHNCYSNDEAGLKFSQV